MTLIDRLGYMKFAWNLGKEYGDLFRGSVTGGAALTFVANWLGLGKVASILVGVALVPVAVGIAITAGYVVIRWRIVHATIEQEWQNNPFQRAQIDTLREIRDAIKETQISVSTLDDQMRWRVPMTLRPSNGYEERAHAQSR